MYVEEKHLWRKQCGEDADALEKIGDVGGEVGCSEREDGPDGWKDRGRKGRGH